MGEAKQDQLRGAPVPCWQGKDVVKCLVWDLDNTLWQGILLEGDALHIASETVAVIKELDRRGILHSIVSRNDPDVAMEQLERFGLSQYFLCPQIGWGDKSNAVQHISESLGLGLDSFAFIDDDPYERDEVRYHLPEVMTLIPENIPALPSMSRFNPRFITTESKMRRQIYQADIVRRQEEERFSGHREDFLATLDMTLTIRKACEDDLERAEELTRRTNQLNTTGRTYSYEELREFIDSPNHLVLMAVLDDSYGPSGTIGLALIDKLPDLWCLRLLIMSCRVISRGIGGVMLGHILRRARDSQVCFKADFIPSGRNRMMYVSYRFLGFEEISEEDGVIILGHSLSEIRAYPDFITLCLGDD